jgi:hypothetical protein
MKTEFGDLYFLKDEMLSKIYKVDVWTILAKDTDIRLGFIRPSALFDQEYCFLPFNNVTFNIGMMSSIDSFIKQLVDKKIINKKIKDKKIKDKK